MGPNHVLQRCVIQEEILTVLKESHEGLARGHLRPDATTHKVLLVGLWWLMVRIDAWEWLVGCDTYQRIDKPLKRDYMLYKSFARDYGLTSKAI